MRSGNPALGGNKVRRIKNIPPNWNKIQNNSEGKIHRGLHYTLINTYE
jgi:hypothetical protein